MPRGHSPYIDDPYGSFANDVRLAYIRATSFDRPDTMSSDELAIVEAVHKTLIDADPSAANLKPPRANRASASAGYDRKGK